MFERLILTGFLVCYSVEDIRKKQVGVLLLFAGALTALFLHLFFRTHTILDMLSGAFLGLALLAVSKLSSGKIGEGDALLLGVTGLFLGFWQNITVFFAGTILAGLYSLVLLGLKKKNRQDEIAFIPFIGIGYLILLFWQAGVL